jgi:transcriptional regulator GlxA family with amidase domain
VLNKVQQPAAELQKFVAVRHAFNISNLRKQANINAPDSGTIWDDFGVARRKTDRRRKALLAEAERVIRARHGEFDLGLADIAEDVGTSTRQLQRVFREIGGTDFRSYVLSVRMERARRLLRRKTNAPSIRAVAREVGFREASGLRQQFVRYFGQNPSEVRSQPTDYDELWKAEEERKK